MSDARAGDGRADVNKETRYNLIFIVLLFAMMLPGAVILFRKKMQPAARPMFEPDPVRKSLAYISPQELPPGMTRVVPPHVREWTTSLMVDRAGAVADRPRDADGMPLMSDRRMFEVLGIATRADGRARVWALWWTAAPKDFQWVVTSSGKSSDVNVARSENLAVPPLVRDELGEAGVLQPPKSVALQELDLSAAPSPPWQLLAKQQNRTIDSADIVTTFTSPAGAKN